MPHDRPADELTPHERYIELAVILAHALRRLRDRAALSALPPSGTISECLEISGKRA